MGKKIKLILIISCFVFSSCSMKNAATTLTAKIIMDGMKAVETESDLYIASQTALPLVKICEVLSEGDPDNEKFLTLMAQIYGNVAFGFFEPAYMKAGAVEKGVWKQRVDRYYRVGYEKGLLAMEKKFGKGAGGPIAEFEKAVNKAGKKDLKLLFWTAFDLGNYINAHKDDVSMIVNVPKVEAMVNKVLDIDPNFVYGSALAFKAAMLASRPPMLGGKPDEAAKLFEESIKVRDGKYLMNKVMYAEWYAIPQGNPSLAGRLLEEVLKAEETTLPEQILANKLAKERASILLSNLKNLK